MELGVSLGGGEHRRSYSTLSINGTPMEKVPHFKYIKVYTSKDMICTHWWWFWWWRQRSVFTVSEEAQIALLPLFYRSSSIRFQTSNITDIEMPSVWATKPQKARCHQLRGPLLNIRQTFRTSTSGEKGQWGQSRMLVTQLLQYCSIRTNTSGGDTLPK